MIAEALIEVEMRDISCGDRYERCRTRGHADYGHFFFQAEDGIRDLVRSRGLGDVYKRQAQEEKYPDHRQTHKIKPVSVLQDDLPTQTHPPTSVSYTHLTLPTSDLV